MTLQKHNDGYVRCINVSYKIIDVNMDLELVSKITVIAAKNNLYFQSCTTSYNQRCFYMSGHADEQIDRAYEEILLLT